MTDYISREALLNFVGNTPTTPVTEREVRLINAFISAIKIFPAADVRENKRGKWIEQHCVDEDLREQYTIPICSVCEETSLGRWNYCPICGAQMEVNE